MKISSELQKEIFFVQFFLKQCTRQFWLRTVQNPPEEITRERIQNWLKVFLPKLKRTSSRTPTCQLISSIERHQFNKSNRIAYHWQNVIFFDKAFFIDRKGLGNYVKAKLTTFQKKILTKNPYLYRKIINRWKINEETGEWKINQNLKKDVISEGGEALVIGVKFGKLDTAVRIQAFDPLLFTKNLPSANVYGKIHLCSGFSLVYALEINKIRLRKCSPFSISSPSSNRKAFRKHRNFPQR